MLLSQSLKISLAVALLTVGFFGSPSARADFGRPEAYEALVAPAPMAPAHAPHAIYGMRALSADEAHHHERLPFQLNDAMAKIKKSKYAPKGLSRDTHTFDF